MTLPVYDIMTNTPVYMLDRNVIITIQKWSSHKNILYKSRLDSLGALDSSQNAFSPLLSIFEGAKQGKDTSDLATIMQIEKEANLLKLFFKKAMIDSTYIKQHAKELLDKKITQYERNFPDLIEFYGVLQSILLNKLKRDNALTVAEQIVNEALKLTIPIRHPIVICAIGVAYGNDFCRKVFKFKEKFEETKAYNAICDILSITRIFLLRAVSIYKNIKIFTFDVPLKQVHEYFIFKGAKVKEPVIYNPNPYLNSPKCEYAFDISPEIFGFDNWENEELQELMALLKKQEYK